MDAAVETFAENIRLPSPLFRVLTFEGREDMRTLLSAVYGLLKDVSWEPPIGERTVRVAVARGRIAGLRIDDAMVFELDSAGQIEAIRPHLRPLLATAVFALLIPTRIAGKPGVLLRALRAR
jgi:hypothetical protein